MGNIVGGTCPTGCNGHGECCGMCECYARGWSTELAWTGHDCADRTCPRGVPWVSVPHYDNGGHVRMLECAGKGICDRKFGMCTCATGFSGRACERAECPNDCSGAGTCLTQEGLAMAAS